MTNDQQKRIQSEKEWHDAEDLQRNDNTLIRGFYGSGIFLTRPKPPSSAR